MKWKYMKINFYWDKTKYPSIIVDKDQLQGRPHLIGKSPIEDRKRVLIEDLVICWIDIDRGYDDAYLCHAFHLTSEQLQEARVFVAELLESTYDEGEWGK